jgi:flap endonuclease-1
MFKEPDVTLDVPELKWTPPDEEVHALTLLAYLQTLFIHPECNSLFLTFFQGLISFLVKDNGFNEDRVTKVLTVSFGSHCLVLQSFLLICDSHVLLCRP